MSHCPPPPSFIRLTISSDEPAGCRLSLQPVAAVNGSAHDLSAYPSHRTRFSWPSPGPTDVGGFMPAVGGCARVVTVGVLLEPHAVMATTTAALRHASRQKLFRPSAEVMVFLPLLVLEHERVVFGPGHPHRPALEILRVAGGFHILA